MSLSSNPVCLEDPVSSAGLLGSLQGISLVSVAKISPCLCSTTPQYTSIILVLLFPQMLKK